MGDHPRVISLFCPSARGETNAPPIDHAFSFEYASDEITLKKSQTAALAIAMGSSAELLSAGHEPFAVSISASETSR